MKKTLLSFLTCSLLMPSAVAQSVFAPEVGLNLANMKITGPSATANTSIETGVVVGANFDIRLADQVSLQPGIFYRMNGAIIKSDHTSKLFVNAVEVPFNFWYKFGKPGTDVFCIGGGPYIALNVAS